jgi:hypothetical protein
MVCTRVDVKDRVGLEKHLSEIKMIQSIFLSLHDLQKTLQPGYCIYLPYKAYGSRYFQKNIIMFFK